MNMNFTPGNPRHGGKNQPPGVNRMKEKIKLGHIQETLLLPLWGRAMEFKKENPKMADKKAWEIFNSIDYDFSKIEKNINEISQICWVVRSIHTDRVIKDFISRFPDAIIVNVGCGLDTVYERMNNDKIMFYDIDLPDVVELRKKFFTDNEKRKTLGISFLDKKFIGLFNENTPILFIAGGVFYYFEEEKIMAFFKALADKFRYCEIYFDAISAIGMKGANKKVLEGGVMNENAVCKWSVNRAKKFEKWDNRIKSIKEPRVYKGLKKGYSLKIKFALGIIEVFKIMKMVHLGISGEGIS